MNERRLAQLLRAVDASDIVPPWRDASQIAMAARTIRRRRQTRARVAVAAMSVLIVGGTIAMMGWQNVDRTPLRSDDRVAMDDTVRELDGEADERLEAINAVSRARQAQRSVRPTQAVRPRHDVLIELDIQRERAAAIILQAADQLREAGRADLASDRYHDLISLFPDTAAAETARQRTEQVKNRT